MTKTELRERIEVWIMIHTNNDRPLPSASSAIGQAVRERAEMDWAAGLLHNVTEMELVPEITNTPAGDTLLSAIALARTGDASKLSAILTCLRQVHAALR